MNAWHCLYKRIGPPFTLFNPVGQHTLNSSAIASFQVPNVSMNPTLEAIQEAINSTAKTILQVCGWMLDKPAFAAHTHLSLCSASLCSATLIECIQPLSQCHQHVPCPPPHQASKKLRCWGQGPNGPATYHDMIARDKEVVKSVLLLTGSVEGIKNQVGPHIRSVQYGAALGFRQCWWRSSYAKPRSKAGMPGRQGACNEPGARSL